MWRWPTQYAPTAASKRPRPWTVEEIRTVRTLVENGYSVAEIARELKRTESAIRYKARLHGLTLAAAPSVVEAAVQV
jgi:DNA-binding NarL/FixJ family response regulator